jgi:NadR type nicotinamide-nucleotide adenylyltransferase
MTRFRHGLVIGKFYPPHQGHHFLIETAAQWSSLVTVVVMAADSETLHLDRRVAWLREMFRSLPRVRIVGAVDNDPTDFESEASWQRQAERIRASLARADASAGAAAPLSVDAVFSSEAYGEELARRFGAVPVCLDPGRQSYPVSGAAVRRDPPGHWHLLPSGVRQALCQRVVIVGAESAV